MKNECNIIRDILPLYIDEIVSEDTASFVETHIEKCTVCRSEYEKMKVPTALEAVVSTTPAKDAVKMKAFQKKWNRRTMLKGFIAAVLLIVFIVGAYLSSHWFRSASVDDLNALARQAERYLDKDELYIEIIVQRGNYMAALCTDSKGVWYMCIYDRDEIFSDRWLASGSKGKNGLQQGTISSWNYGNPQGDAVLIFSGVHLSDDVCWYTFQNDKTTYTCPVEDNTVLDIFIITDSNNINGIPTMLDAEQQPIQ